MPISTTAPVLSPLACHNALLLLRALGDGEWTTVTELAQATGRDTDGVAASLLDLEAAGFVQHSQDRYRIDCTAVREAFAAAVAEVANQGSATS